MIARAPVKFLATDTDRHGNVRTYVRKNGRKIRIHAKLGSPDFWVEYQAAIAAIDAGRVSEKTAAAGAAVIPGSFRALCIGFYGSATYKGYDTRTRDITKRVLDGLCEKHGTKPANRLEPRHVEAWRDERADKPGAANELVKKARAALKWGASQTPPYIATNVAMLVPYLDSNNPDGFATWAVEELKKFRDHWPLGTKPRLALELAAFVGVRRSDVARLGPQNERGDELHFTEFKGRKKKPKHRKIPIMPELRAAIDAMPDKGKGLAYLLSERNRAYSAASLGNSFRKWANAAGLHHLSLHGIRKAAATIAAENGASEWQMMAVFGWSSPKMAALYTRKANADRLTAGAIHLLQPKQDANEIVPPGEVVRDSATERDEKSKKIKA
jgi:hypothetical protein